MKKFVFIYNGPQATEKPADDTMDKWMKWFGDLGEKLVDGGNPFGGDVKEVAGDGVKAVTENRALGYSIVNAQSMDEAIEMAKGCPNVGYDGYSVTVYEAFPM